MIRYADRHPNTGRFLAYDCETDCLERCAGLCGSFTLTKESPEMTTTFDDQADDRRHDRIEWAFTNHAPIDPVIAGTFETVRAWAKGFAHHIIDVCPDSPERERALIRLEETLAAAGAAIARNQVAVLERIAAQRQPDDGIAPLGFEELHNSVVHHVDCPITPCDCEPIQ